MAYWARIQDDIVMEITEIDPTGNHHPDLVWVKCVKGTGERDSYDSSTKKFTKFVIPEPPKDEDITMEADGAKVQGEDLPK